MVTASPVTTGPPADLDSIRPPTKPARLQPVKAARCPSASVQRHRSGSYVVLAHIGSADFPNNNQVNEIRNHRIGDLTMLTTSEVTSPPAASSGRQTARFALVVGALGVVFGDIGTSPIYTVQTIFNPGDPHPVQSSLQSIFGVVSLIFWSVTIIVT